MRLCLGRMWPTGHYLNMVVGLTALWDGLRLVIVARGSGRMEDSPVGGDKAWQMDAVINGQMGGWDRWGRLISEEGRMVEMMDR